MGNNKEGSSMQNDRAPPQRKGAAQEAVKVLERVFAKTQAWPSPTGLLTYEPRPTDIIITTFPKAGTTLVQHLAYQVVVATGGAPIWDPEGTAFKDLNDVAPWVDYLPQMSAIPCESCPRVFKSHSSYPVFLAAKCTTQKHIIVIRNPADYPSSWMDFLFDDLSNFTVSDEVVREEAFHAFVRHRLLGFPLSWDEDNGDIINKLEEKRLSLRRTYLHTTPGPWFSHTESWVYDAPPFPATLVLFYEDIINDLENAAHRIATYIGRSLTAEQVTQIVTRCERKRMACDKRFNCIIEARCFGFGHSVEKAKPFRKTGFKQFVLHGEERRELRIQMQTTFSVDTYNEFKFVINEKQDHIIRRTYSRIESGLI